jgi:hypothetical protein
VDFLNSYWKVIVFGFVPLSLLRFWWVNHHYRQPMAAFKALAIALESDDSAALAKLAPRSSKVYWEEIAKPFGDTRTFGKLLRQSSKVEAVIHLPLASVDVLCHVPGDIFCVHFLSEKDGFTVGIAFLRDSD